MHSSVFNLKSKRLIQNMLKNKNWKSVLAPISLCFLLSSAFWTNNKIIQCIAMTVTLSAFLILEILPMAATCLIPLIYLPFTDIISTKAMVELYSSSTSMTVISIFAMSITFKESNCSKRIALKILLMSGVDFKWMILGFILASGFLAMWMEALTSTTLLISVAEHLFQEMDKIQEVPDDCETIEELKKVDITDLEVDFKSPHKTINPGITKSATRRNFRISIFLAILYGGCYGATGAMSGCALNFFVVSNLREFYGTTGALNFTTWILFGATTTLPLLLISWLWLTFLHVGFRSDKTNTAQQIRKIIQESYNDLGPMTYYEIEILLLYVLQTVILLSRDPGFIKGWIQIFNFNGIEINEMVPMMFSFILLFLIPIIPESSTKNNNIEVQAERRTLMNWKTLNHHMPWDFLFFFGAGRVMATTVKLSGLADVLVENMQFLVNLPLFVVLLISTTFCVFLTEFFSNVTIINIMLPIMAKASDNLQMNPILLMLPSEMASVYSIMMPIGSYASFLIYQKSGITLTEMIKSGFVMNLISPLILSASTISLGVTIFGYEAFSTHIQQTTVIQNITETHIQQAVIQNITGTL